MLPKSLVPLLLLGALFLPGCLSKKPQEGRVVARFAGQTLTDEDFRRKADSLPRDLRAAAYRQKDKFLDDLVGERFLLREALNRKLDQDPEVSDLIEQARQKILVAKLIQTEVDSKLSSDEGEARRYYDLNQEEFMTPLLWRASHILVKTREEAQQLRAEIDAGADFEETARRKSIDPTAIRGGDLGFFQKGQFVPEFEQVVIRMTKGQIEGPVESPFGWHIIKLTDRVEPTQRPFEAVQERIRERLMLEKRSQLFRDYLQKIKGNSKVDVDSSVLAAIEPAGRPKEEA